MTALEIIGIITSFISAGGLGTILCLKYSKKKVKAEADCVEAEANTKEWELEEKRIKHLHDMVENCNETIAKLLTHINTKAEESARLDEKMEELRKRNRELSDRLYDSEQALNKANATITELTEQRDKAQHTSDYYKMWRCQRCDCQDPRGREPDNPMLKGLTYVDPELEYCKEEPKKPVSNGNDKERKPRRGGKTASAEA